MFHRVVTCLAGIHCLARLMRIASEHNLVVIHTIIRYLYDSLSRLFEQIGEHFTGLTFAAMTSDAPSFPPKSGPLLRMGCCCKF